MISIWKINSQNSIFSDFPIIDSLQTSINSKILLDELNWDNLVKFCDTTEGHYARKYENEFTTTYKYTKQGLTANFTLVEFNGKVLEFYSHKDEVFNTNYFDRNTWIEYTKLDDQFKDSKWILNKEEMSIQGNVILQSYYALLGFNSRDEYGWICEYSATGLPPDKRLAVINLINYKNRDLLVKLLDHPNTQTKLYAADALIYLEMIKEIENVEIREFKKRRTKKRYLFKYSANYKLSKKEWQKINKLKDENIDVITCGNMGSYKQYKSTTKKLLSTENLNKIFDNYQSLRELGYLW